MFFYVTTKRTWSLVEEFLLWSPKWGARDIPWGWGNKLKTNTYK
jgi:hypothetical protein